MKSKSKQAKLKLFETWSVLLCEMDNETYIELLKRKEKLFELIEVATYSAAKDDLYRCISRDSHKYNGVQKRYEIFRELINVALKDYCDIREVVSLIKEGKKLALAQI
jgi:hypothetical protein